IVEYLPFRAVYDIPLTILLDKGSATDIPGILILLAIQLVWAVIMYLASMLFWKYSVRRITVNGG
ncbi:MAG: ABC-2 family transporter protein, partial [Clostridiales bacterium]|nr:ABC-2 family transporter protein [Clostridiales bacterium]